MHRSVSSARAYAPHLQRVVLVDPNPASARFLFDVLKEQGAADIACTGNAQAGLEMVSDLNPQIIFCELDGPKFDGLAFVRSLRRSPLESRATPVILIAAEPTAAGILAAREAGVHEVLRRPFTMKDPHRRLEAVTACSRAWIDVGDYVGPDRRRFNLAMYEGKRKRSADFKEAGEAPASAANKGLKAG